jgi:hypothetical protein
MPDQDLPERWQSILTPLARREPRAPPPPGILAAAVAELPELDSAQITIIGLHHGEPGTIMHLLVSGVILEEEWAYARGVRPLPVLWIRDSDGRWHATDLDSVSPWGEHRRDHGVDEAHPPAGSRHHLDPDHRRRAIGPSPGHTAAQPAAAIHARKRTGFLCTPSGTGS